MVVDDGAGVAGMGNGPSAQTIAVVVGSWQNLVVVVRVESSVWRNASLWLSLVTWRGSGTYTIVTRLVYSVFWGEWGVSTAVWAGSGEMVECGNGKVEESLLVT
jgi:hypothetical protein